MKQPKESTLAICQHMLSIIVADARPISDNLLLLFNVLLSVQRKKPTFS